MSVKSRAIARTFYLQLLHVPLRLFRFFAFVLSKLFVITKCPLSLPPPTAGVSTTLTSFLLTLSPQCYPSRFPINGTYLAKYTIPYTRLRQITLHTRLPCQRRCIPPILPLLPPFVMFLLLSQFQIEE